MPSSKEAFLSLVRLGIGHKADTLPQTVDWQILKALAESQGLSAVVLDGIEKLPEAQRPPKVFLLESKNGKWEPLSDMDILSL